MPLDVIVLLYIALILVVAKIFGEIAERLKFSSMVGEVLAGVLLGPVIGIVRPDAFLEQIAGFGIIFLLFLIGLHTNFDSVRKDMYKASVLGIIAAGLSFAGGFLVGLWLLNDVNAGIFIGVILMSTSTAVGLRSLIDIGEIKTRVYEMTLAIDLADDVIAILALSLLTSYFSLGAVQVWKVAALFFAVLGFIVVITTVGSKAVAKFLEIFKIMKDEQMLIAIPLVIVFVVSFLAEQVGIAGVTGAFLAGMAMNRSGLAESTIIPKVKTLGHGFFIPLFFAYSAIVFDLAVFRNSIHIVLIVLAIAALAKFIGAGYFSRVYRFNPRDQVLLGVGLIPRGEYAIVISQIALTAGIITSNIYTIMIAFVILSIIITPLLMRFAAKVKHF